LSKNNATRQDKKRDKQNTMIHFFKVQFVEIKQKIVLLPQAAVAQSGNGRTASVDLGNSEQAVYIHSFTE